MLLDARRGRIASTLSLYREIIFVFWALSEIYAFYWLWRSGTASRLSKALRRRIRSPVWLRFTFGTIVAALAGVAAIPASLAGYRVGLVFDQSSEPVWRFVRDGALRLTLDALAAGVIVALCLTLVERTRQWWIYSIAVLFAASIAVGWLEPDLIAPLYNSYVPLADSHPEAAQLHALAASAEVPHAPFYVSDASRQTDLPMSTVLGFGPSARIVLGDTLFLQSTPGEVLFAAGRELDHLRQSDAERTSVVFAILFVLSIAVAVLLAERIRFRADDDVLSRLALVGALAGVAGLIAYPLYNGYLRHIERKADGFAVSITHDPASAVRTLVRAADARFVPLCMPRAVEVYFSPLPMLGTRIASITGERNPCR